MPARSHSAPILRQSWRHLYHSLSIGYAMHCGASAFCFCYLLVMLFRRISVTSLTREVGYYRYELLKWADSPAREQADLGRNQASCVVCWLCVHIGALRPCRWNNLSNEFIDDLSMCDHSLWIRQHHSAVSNAVLTLACFAFLYSLLAILRSCDSSQLVLWLTRRLFANNHHYW